MCKMQIKIASITGFCGGNKFTHVQLLAQGLAAISAIVVVGNFFTCEMGAGASAYHGVCCEGYLSPCAKRPAQGVPQLVGLCVETQAYSRRRQPKCHVGPLLGRSMWTPQAPSWPQAALTKASR